VWWRVGGGGGGGGGRFPLRQTTHVFIVLFCLPQAAKEAAAATVMQGKQRALTAGKKMAEARAEREYVATRTKLHANTPLITHRDPLFLYTHTHTYTHTVCTPYP